MTTGKDYNSHISWLAPIIATQHFGLPGPPMGLVAHSGNGGSVLLTWQPPRVDGGTSVTGFEASVFGTMKSCRTGRDECRLDGFVAGRRYRAVVYDLTAKGRSLEVARWFVAE
jgi:hypothetical protein